MHKNRDLNIILSQIDAPAFLVQDDSVCAVNAAATQYNIEIGKNVLEMIIIGGEEYLSLQTGSLYITLSISGTLLDFSVTKLEDQNLFILESKPAQTDLQLLSLAAKQLSFPLSELSILINKTSETENKEKINKILFRLHRITNNMSDAIHLQNTFHNLQTTELCSLLKEILVKSQTLLEDTATELTYQLPNVPVYTAASAELLERAVYNLLSNGVKYGTNKINVSLIRGDNKAYISVTNNRIAALPQGNLFSRYRRIPGIENPNYGLGLGMTLVHTIARIHGGAVLIETPNEQEIKVTISISLKHVNTGIIRSPILKPDIYGGRDRALVELSDVLPAHLYNSKKF